ncbi:hypothetical protein [Pragia fontium]|uniref:Uncharacterized protein n=1 Tax=Pragia fontium DSM 5563 = ATCC 49100 TaxID=1122977 RepID=A0AAJ4WA20_9GAMM|nr:hypothetical protein [Pragia fontium]SFC66385.1 hypothetical protein SAMN02745723_103245 [Pragia fontium DSM 5563 = ATCC 49100]VEJ56468.1 Uncharacterised protein [Pragia fontium]
MSNINFITAKFTRCDKNSNQDYPCCYRIITSLDTFYFLEDQFLDLNVLDKLEKGDIIHIGAHSLDDGTYWLHWLLSEEKGSCEVVQRLKFTIFQKMTLILYFLSVFFHIIDHPSIITIIALFTLPITLICSLNIFIKCINFFSVKARIQRIHFSRAKKGDLSFMRDTRNEKRKRQYFSDITLHIIDGTAQDIEMRLTSKHQNLIINFNISGILITLREYAYSLTKTTIPIVHYTTHPTFIAENDRLKLLIDNNKVKAIVNRTDRATYLLCNPTWMSNQKVKKILLHCYSIMIPALLFGYPIFIMTISDLNSYIYFFTIIVILPTPYFIVFLYYFFSLFGDHSSTKQALSWLLKITDNKPPKEIWQ